MADPKSHESTQRERREPPRFEPSREGQRDEPKKKGKDGGAEKRARDGEALRSKPREGYEEDEDEAPRGPSRSE